MMTSCRNRHSATLFFFVMSEAEHQPSGGGNGMFAEVKVDARKPVSFSCNLVSHLADQLYDSTYSLMRFSPGLLRLFAVFGLSLLAA